MRLNELRIGTRLGGLLVGVGVVAVLLLLVSSMQFNALLKSTDTVTDRLKVMHDADSAVQEYRQRETRLLFINSAKEAEAEEKAMQAAMARAEARLKTLAGMTPDDGKARLDALSAALSQYAKVSGQFVKMTQDDAQRSDAEGFLNNETMAAFKAALAKLSDVSTLQFELTARQQKDTQAQATRMMTIGMGILLVVGIGVGIPATMTVRQLTASVREAVTIAQTVASGDLNSVVVVEGSDEMAELMQALKDMNTSLASIVGTVRSGTETIAGASTQIASGNHDLSTRTEMQASSLEETASSMEELTSTVKQNADNATQASVLSSAASEVAMRGGQVVSQVVETMGSINESSRKIVDIIGVIDGIAFQTNILALNAAVEAARAGEQGRGFAVVASEVRSLAQRSAAAAKEIKELIGDSVEKVENGARLVDQAGHTMEEIVASVKRVTDIITEIASANQEQNSGINQINEAILQMDQATQENAALVEQAAAAAEAMQDQARTLASAVSIFKLNESKPVAIPGRPRLALAK